MKKQRTLKPGYPGFELEVDGCRIGAYLMRDKVCIPVYTPDDMLTVDQAKALVKVLEKTIELAESQE